jgi:hypothetical protein
MGSDCSDGGVMWQVYFDLYSYRQVFSRRSSTLWL